MKKILLLLTSILCNISISAQDMTVRRMEPLPMDTYASTHKRLDLNGNACAVVRVSLTVSGATFSGNVVGEVTRDGSDYLVYMPQGSKKLWVKHPNYHELEVNFADYGIDRLQSLATYRVTVNAPNATIEQKMQVLNIKVTPSDAMVLIDDEMVEGNSTNLVVGSHKYKVLAKGYESQSGTIDVTENRMAKLTVELDRKVSSPQEKTETDNRSAQNTQQSSQTVQPQPVNPLSTHTPQTFTVNGVSFTMMPVEGGTFTMGATPEIENPDKDEKPAHQVTLSSYYIGETEVTQELWQTVMGTNPSTDIFGIGPELPVNNVSMKDCQKFIENLNQMTGQSFRLPTEAEWEFAARGGSNSQHTQYSGSNNVDEVAWHRKNSGDVTHPVKQKKSNELGIYDMSGNVSEWCQDKMKKYKATPQFNPMVTSGVGYILRGGNFYNVKNCCRTSFRYSSFSMRMAGNGLRLALSE